MAESEHFDGFWWLPESPDDEMSGRLIIGEDGARLTLTINSGLPQVDAKQSPVFHGRTSSGKPITLLACFVTSSQWTSAGIELRTIFANYVLIGGDDAKSEDDKVFCKMSLKWPELNRWFRKTGLTVAHGTENFDSFDVSFRKPSPISLTYEDGTEVRFSFGTDRFPVEGAHSVEFNEVTWVEIKPTSNESLNYYLERLSELIHFFSLCCLDYVEPVEVNLVSEDENATENAFRHTYHTARVRSDKKPNRDGKLEAYNSLLLYPAIEDDFPDVLSRWEQKCDSLKSIRSLYFYSLYGSNRYIEAGFMQLAQAAEAIHRTQRGGNLVSKDAFKKKILPSLKKALNDSMAGEEVDPDAVGQLESRLSYINQISLFKRLDELSTAHASALDTMLPKHKSFLRGIVKARNYFTHPSDGEEYPSASYLQLYREFLSTLIELEMLSQAGIKPSVLYEAAKKCETYRWRFFRIRI